jgi:glycerophosphoryl diester phosphodiesterase
VLADSGQPTELWIELKTAPYDRTTSSDPMRLLDQVLVQIENSGLAAQTVLLAFEWDVLVRAKQLMPSVQTNFLTINTETLRLLNKRYGEVDPGMLFGQYNPQDFSNSVVNSIAAAGGDYWGPWIKDATAESVGDAHAAGLLVDLWGVESSEVAITYAKSLNGDAITTGNPTLI